MPSRTTSAARIYDTSVKSYENVFSHALVRSSGPTLAWQEKLIKPCKTFARHEFELQSGTDSASVQAPSTKTCFFVSRTVNWAYSKKIPFTGRQNIRFRVGGFHSPQIRNVSLKISKMRKREWTPQILLDSGFTESHWSTQRIFILSLIRHPNVYAHSSWIE